MKIRRILFQILVVFYVAGMVFLIVCGASALIEYLKPSGPSSGVTVISESGSKKSVEFYSYSPSPTPRLDELNRLVYEQLKKEAAEAEAKKTARKEK